MKIADLQKRLSRIQLAVLGYEQYRIRSKRYWQPEGKRKTTYFIDVYTTTGLLIKTKLNHLRISEVADFVKGVEFGLSTADV